MKKWVFITLIIILLGLVSLGVISNDRMNSNSELNLSSFDSSVENIINVDNQIVDESVRVKKAVLDQSGFIVVHKDSSGAPGQVIGTSNLLEPGDYSGIEIDLSEKIESGDKLYAMIRQDNGDGVFNSQEDNPITNEEDNIVFVRFKSSSN